MTRRFSSTEHLGPEAVAAFVDGELSACATRRAQDHIAQCQECHEEVMAQRGASQRMRFLRTDEHVKAPTSLIEKLANMCDDDELHDGTEAKRSPREKLADALQRFRQGRVT
ncbi:anti-sigma factor family protein [Corynebacterium riegelii]|uniref:anti-sigma factor family protein n=1 Tax=Corynebacterium riegelii TaxID=156976 RepID=UPI00288A021B|nr:anti-sigma factor [Corynebacterium riegelii]